MRAHNPAPRTHQTIDVLEVIAAAIHIHKDARKRRSQDSGALFVQVSVQIAYKCISKPVCKRLKPGLSIVRGRDVGQRLRPVMGDTHENGGLRFWRRVLDQWKPVHHTVVLAPINRGMACAPSRMTPSRGMRPRHCCQTVRVRWIACCTMRSRRLSPV